MVHGCDIPERSAQQGRTALMFALAGGGLARSGNTEVVSLLLEKGADVNAAGEDGPTALHTGRDPLLERPRARSCCRGPRMRHL